MPSVKELHVCSFPWPKDPGKPERYVCGICGKAFLYSPPRWERAYTVEELRERINKPHGDPPGTLFIDAIGTTGGKATVSTTRTTRDPRVKST